MPLRDHLPSLIARYIAGETLEQIGSSHGVSRERVRQLLTREGIRRNDGGQAATSRANRQRYMALLKERQNARAFARYGCDHETLRRLNGGFGVRANGTLADKYHSQRHNAQKRGIAWEFTFPDWVAAWEASGHLHERGRAAEKFCMARIGDMGPYSPSNVYFTTLAENGADYQRARLAKLGCEVKGWSYKPENTRRPYVVRVRRRNIGCYATENEARIAYQAAKRML